MFNQHDPTTPYLDCQPRRCVRMGLAAAGAWGPPRESEWPRGAGGVSRRTGLAQKGHRAAGG